MKVWNAVAQILQSEGVEYLFNFPAHPLIDACAKIGIRPIVCRQERVGVGIADGYTRATAGRRTGVFAMQSGPGAENAFAGIAAAYADGSPILVLPLGHDRAHAQVRPFFSADNAYRRVTRHLETLMTPEQTVDVMRRAFGELRAGPPGPVMVELPRDVGDLEISDFAVDGYRPVVPARGCADPADVDRAAAALLEADRPVILAGQGVLYAEAWRELEELVDLVGVPVATTLAGMSAFSERHPLALGTATVTNREPVVRFISETDCLLGVGTSLTGGDIAISLPESAGKIQITNNPSDFNKSYAIAHPLLGDAKLVLGQLVEACRDRLGGVARDSRELASEISASTDAWMSEWMHKLKSSEQPLTPYRVIGDFVSVVDPDEAIVTHDCGSPRHQLTPFYRPSRPHSYMGWGKSHALGTGLGLMMGAKLAHPSRLCVHFMGDAAFGMTGLDLETAVRCEIPTLSVVFNNSTMANESSSMAIAHARYGTRDLGGDICSVAQALGLWAERVTEPDEIIPSIARARAATEAGRPALLEFITSAETDMSLYRSLHGQIVAPAGERLASRRRDLTRVMER